MPPKMQPPIGVIENPLPSDCLLGRGRDIENHEGNRLYRNLIQRFVPRYLEVRDNPRRSETSQLILEIMLYLQNEQQMRFLFPLDEALGLWKLADQENIRKKVGQVRYSLTHWHPFAVCLD